MERSRAMYRVLYRKWRPSTFSDVAGQPQVTQTLKNEIQMGRLAHAYLFTGSRGTGKTSCAKILAKAVNCLSPKGGDPCNECEICRGIDSGSILDVVEIDAASNNGVDNIRDLREEANYTPAAAKYRVYIIDEVHMLSTGAFNALLKTLEEPPAHVIFILATTEVHKLPATILSRCQRFDFHRIKPEDIASRLQYVAKEEAIELDGDAALLIARLADGALRDALSLLDQCAGDGVKVDAARVSQVAGLAGREYLFDLARAVLHRDSSAALQIIHQLHNASCDIGRLCEELLTHYRNLMLVKTLKDPSGLIVCPDYEMKQYRELAAEYSSPALLHALTLLQATLQQISAGAPRRMAMEMALLRLTNPALDDTNEALLRRIDALEAAVRSGVAFAPTGAKQPAPAAPAEVPAQREPEPSSSQAFPPSQEDEERPPLPEEPPEQAEPPAPPPAPPYPSAQEEGDGGEEQPLSHWPDILAALAKRNPLMASVLKGSAAYLKGDLLLIDSQNAQFRDLIKDGSKNRNDIREAAAEVTGLKLRLGPYRRREKAAESDPFMEFLGRMRSLGAPLTEQEE